jgi:23S rRNA pseudouridine1911/1915/1917 synthase
MDAIREAWRHQGRKHVTRLPLMIVHRIDKETSGLLVFARSKAAERALQAQLRAHTVERSYLCVAHGTVPNRTIESSLIKDRGDGLRGSTRRPGQGKRAITHVRALQPLGTVATLCEVRLETGKTHQVRIHLAEAGHPLVGERVYIRDFERRGGHVLVVSRLMLHAATLGFAHPSTGKPMRFAVDPPATFRDVVEKLRGKNQLQR